MEIISEIQNTHLKILTDLYVKLEPFTGYFDEDCYYDFSYYWQPIESFKDDAVKYNLNISSYVKYLDMFIDEFKKEGYPNEDVLELLKLKHDILYISDNGDNSRDSNHSPSSKTQSNNQSVDFWSLIKDDLREDESFKEKVINRIKGNKGVNLAHLIYALDKLGHLVVPPTNTSGRGAGYGNQKAFFCAMKVLGAVGKYESYSNALTSNKYDNPKAKFKIDNIMRELSA